MMRLTVITPDRTIVENAEQWSPTSLSDSMVSVEEGVLYVINGDRMRAFAPGRWSSYVVEEIPDTPAAPSPTTTTKE